MESSIINALKKGLDLEDVGDIAMQKFAYVFNAIPMDICGDFQCIVPERQGICVEYGNFCINFEGDGLIRVKERHKPDVLFIEAKECVEHILKTYH